MGHWGVMVVSVARSDRRDGRWVISSSMRGATTVIDSSPSEKVDAAGQGKRLN